MSEAVEPGKEGGGQLSFWEHLAELRKRLLVCVFSLVGGFVVAWVFKEPLFTLISAPVKEGLAAHGIYRLTAIETIEAIMVYLKLSVAAAIVASIPVALYQVWAFVRPGLMPNETRPMRRVAVLAIFMFVVGLLFCYRFVLPLVIDFLTGFTLGAGDVDFQVTMKSAYSTTLVFLVGFGVIFELPLVMVLLAATPLFNAQRYWKWIRYSIVISFVIGSMLTPPDILSQALMAVPITILYVIGTGLTYLSERRREAGRPVASGIDWQLVGSVLLLCLLIAALSYRPPPPLASHLPYGAQTVALGRTAEGWPGCGAVRPDQLSDLPMGGEFACARYREGAVLLAALKPGADEGACAALAGSPTACLVEDGVLLAGEPVLVARTRRNRSEGRQDSDPLLLDDDATLSFFASLHATPREQRAYLRIGLLGGEDPHVVMDLSFQDPKGAKEFVEALAGDQPVGTATPPQDPVVAALGELTVAMEELAADLPPERASALKGRLARARRLAGLQEDGEATPTGLLQCDSSPCAYAFLAPHLPEPDEDPDIKGRVVHLRFPLEPASEAGENLRRNLFQLLPQ